MDMNEMREAVEAFRAAMPKMPAEKILLHDERDFAALSEFINRQVASPYGGALGDLLGIPIHYDADVPSGVLRACYRGGIAVDTPIR